MSKRRWLATKLGILLLAAALLCLVAAPASRHGATAHLSRSRHAQDEQTVKIATVSHRSLPGGPAYSAVRVECIFRPPEAKPHTLVLELTGGARLQVGETVTDLQPNPAIHRHVFDIPDSPVSLSLQYAPLNTLPFFRLLNWDRETRTLDPVPASWIYPSTAEMSDAGSAHHRSRLLALAFAAIGLLVLGVALPPHVPPMPQDQRIRWQPFVVAICAAVALHLVNVAARFSMGELLIRGDAQAFIDMTRSLIEDGDLDLRGQARLHLYENPPPGAFLSESETVVALGKNGNFYPKHPWIVAVLAAPFYAWLGPPGFLLLNVLMVALLAAAMYWCASAAGAEPRLAVLVTLVLAASPILLGMSYSISSDLSGAALSTAGLALVARGLPFVGGLLAGVSLLTRVTNGWIALAAVLLLLRSPSVLRFVLGCIPGVAVLLAMNWHMFGSPFRMSYDNVLVLVQGQRAIASHSGLFDRALGTGMMEQMFEWPRGLAFSAPLATLAWVGLPLLVKQRALLGLATLVAAGGLYVTFAVHVYTGDSPFGLRYLLPMIGLAAVPLGALLQQVLGQTHE